MENYSYCLYAASHCLTTTQYKLDACKVHLGFVLNVYDNFSQFRYVVVFDMSCLYFPNSFTIALGLVIA